MLTRMLIAIPAGILLAFAALGVQALVNDPGYCEDLDRSEGVLLWQNDRTGNDHCIQLEEWDGTALP